MSIRTTYFGPKVSVTTAVGTNDPSAGGFQVSVPFILDGSNLQTVKAASATLGAGRLSLISHSATSIVLAFDSGTTVYTFVNATAE